MKRATFAQSPRMVTEASQSYSFSRRAILLGGLQGAVGVALAGRMAWLAIAENARYSSLSESNRVNMTLVPPRRGWIVDRHGAPIANNRTDFRVDIIPDPHHNFVNDLFQHYRVITYLGDWFGAPDRVRLSYALDAQKIDEGLNRINDYLAHRIVHR